MRARPVSQCTRPLLLIYTCCSLGATLITIGLPIGCYAFAFLCNDISGCPAPSILSPSKLFNPPALSGYAPTQYALETLKREVGWPGWAGLINVEAVLGTLAWYATSLALYAVLPAQEVQGVELRGGGRLTYRFNGVP